MLFKYYLIPHGLGKFQNFLDFIFLDVWCQSPWSSNYSSLISKSPKFQRYIELLDNSQSKAAEEFLKEIESIFYAFKSLDSMEIWRLKNLYILNSNIEKACDNSQTRKPVAKNLIKKMFKERRNDLIERICNLFYGIYDNGILKLIATEEIFGNITDHYRKFISVNKIGVCPFCGLSYIKGIYNTKREAYDHYLPRSIYPFTSINFKNLAPCCNECNSSYKRTKDPLNYPSGTVRKRVLKRRKAFYPFSSNIPKIDLDLMDLKTNGDDFTEIDLLFSEPSGKHFDEIQTWLDIYGIRERYRAKILDEHGGKYWLMQATDECSEKSMSSVDYMDSVRRGFVKSPYYDATFIKFPFLLACVAEGYLVSD